MTTLKNIQKDPQKKLERFIKEREKDTPNFYRQIRNSKNNDLTAIEIQDFIENTKKQIVA